MVVGVPGFKRIRLKEIGYTYGGLGGKSGSDFIDGETQYITFVNVINNVIAKAHLIGYVRIAQNEIQNKVLEGDLLFNGSSETAEEVAFPSLVPAVLSGSLLNSFCFGFRFTNLHEVDPLYFAYLLRSNVGRPEISKLAQGSTRINISKTALINLEWLVPPLNEQREIAKALSDVDELIEVISQLINKKAEIFEGALQAEFSESSGAILTSVSDICDVSKGAAVKYDKDFIQGSFGFLNGGINFSGLTEFSNDSGDTVVVSEGGNSCGFVNYIPAPFWCGGHAYRLLGFPGKQKYLYYALKKSETEIMNLRVGSGLPNIQKKNLSEFQIPIHADPKKQEEVVNFLDSLMGEIAFLKSELAKYECIKQGMAHDLITGKVRLV